MSALILVATGWLFYSSPKGFLTSEDQGQIYAMTEAAQGVSYKDMVRHQLQVANALLNSPDGKYVNSFLVMVPRGTMNQGFMVARFIDRSQRPHVDQIIQRLRPRLNSVPGITAFLQNPPLIRIGGTFTKASEEKQAAPAAPPQAEKEASLPKAPPPPSASELQKEVLELGIRPQLETCRREVGNVLSVQAPSAGEKAPAQRSAQRVARRVAGAAMAETFDQIGAAIPLRVPGRVRCEGLLVEEKHVPAEHAPADVEREMHLAGLVRLLDRRHALHEIGIERLDVLVRHLGEGGIGHRRIKIMAVRGDAATIAARARAIAIEQSIELLAASGLERPLVMQGCPVCSPKTRAMDQGV